MKITKRQLRRIIREEKRRVAEACGDVDAAPALDLGVTTPAAPLAESALPEQEMIVEMEVAQAALEQVVESVQGAAALCPDCGPEVAVQAPLMEAMVAQAEALQETLAAQAELVAESAGLSVGTSAGSEDELAAVLDVVADPAAV